MPGSSLGFTNNSNSNFGSNSSQNFDYSSASNASFRNAQMGAQPSSISQLPPIANQFNTHQNGMQTQLEREANLRQLQRANSLPKGQSELNRISNKLYNDNQPTRDYPNHSYWFGRAGTVPKVVNGKHSLGSLLINSFILINSIIIKETLLIILIRSTSR